MLSFGARNSLTGRWQVHLLVYYRFNVKTQEQEVEFETEIVCNEVKPILM